jgi:hypothetical protein
LPKAPSDRAELSWLKSDKGLDENGGITWRGQTHRGTKDGRLVGARDIINIPASPKPGPGGERVFSVPVPAGAAVLLVTEAPYE